MCVCVCVCVKIKNSDKPDYIQILWGAFPTGTRFIVSNPLVLFFSSYTFKRTVVEILYSILVSLLRNRSRFRVSPWLFSTSLNVCIIVSSTTLVVVYGSSRHFTVSFPLDSLELSATARFVFLFSPRGSPHILF